MSLHCYNAAGRCTLCGANQNRMSLFDSTRCGDAGHDRSRRATWMPNAPMKIDGNNDGFEGSPMLSEKEDPQRRFAAFLSFTPEHLRAVLDLPKNVEITHITWDWRYSVYHFTLSGPGLPEKCEQRYDGCKAEMLPMLEELRLRYREAVCYVYADNHFDETKGSFDTMVQKTRTTFDGFI